MKMDATMIRRTEQALKETRAALARETAYREDLRDRLLVGFYMQHIAKLENMLELGEFNEEHMMKS